MSAQNSTAFEQISTFHCNQHTVRAARFSIDGNYAISAGSDKTVKIWNPVRKTLLRSYIGHGYEVRDVRGSCDNSSLLSGGADKVVIVWDVTTGVHRRKFRSHLGAVNCVRFNEDSSMAISGSVDGTVRCWDLKSKQRGPVSAGGEAVQTLSDASDSITSLDVSDHEILSSSLDGKVRLYDLRAGRVITDDIGGGGKVASPTCASLTSDGNCILVSSLPATGDRSTKTCSIKLIDKVNGQLLQEFDGHTNRQYRIESITSPGDDHIISGSELDGCIYIWDLVEGTIVATLDHLKTSSATGTMSTSMTVHSVSHHPGQQSILTASQGSLFLWSKT